MSDRADRVSALEAYHRDEVATCVRCPLSEGRTQVVVGSGDLAADLMFVGQNISNNTARPIEVLTAVARGTAEARAIVRHAGGKSIYVAGHVAVHPGGTAKVGDVVDTDLQTEIHGRYGGGASVSPREWGLPPSFTALAPEAVHVKDLFFFRNGVPSR